MSVDLEAVVAAELQREREHKPTVPSALYSRLDLVSGLLRAAPPETAGVPRLLWRDPEGAVRTVAVDRSRTLGREAGCDVVLPAPRVSRRHARIERAESGWAIVDLTSANGTEVNGVNIGEKPRTLRDGDVIALGGMALAYVE